MFGTIQFGAYWEYLNSNPQPTAGGGGGGAKSNHRKEADPWAIQWQQEIRIETIILTFLELEDSHIELYNPHKFS